MSSPAALFDASSVLPARTLKPSRREGAAQARPDAFQNALETAGRPRSEEGQAAHERRDARALERIERKETRPEPPRAEKPRDEDNQPRDTDRSDRPTRTEGREHGVKTTQEQARETEPAPGKTAGETEKSDTQSGPETADSSEGQSAASDTTASAADSATATNMTPEAAVVSAAPSAVLMQAMDTVTAEGTQALPQPAESAQANADPAFVQGEGVPVAPDVANALAGAASAQPMIAAAAGKSAEADEALAVTAPSLEAGPAVMGTASPRTLGSAENKAGSSDPATAMPQSTATADKAAMVAPETLKPGGPKGPESAKIEPSVTPSLRADVQPLLTTPVAAPASGAHEALKLADPTAQAQRAEQPVPVPALAVEIGMRALRGAKEFQIKLDPEDLGRIDVSLEVDDSGSVQARVIVERVDTLQMLQRDAKTLERAFEQAGLKTNPDGLQFSLKDGQQQGRHADAEASSRGSSRPAAEPDAAIDPIELRTVAYRHPAAGGLDIRI